MDNRNEAPMDPMAMVLSALRFSANKHRDQRRKDPDKTPYINHPIEVMAILYFEGGVRDHHVLTAAVLHDTVEDTLTTLDEVRENFGGHVANIVSEVTDDTTLPRTERKQHQISRAPFISNEAKLVKLADKISNLRDVHSSPPTAWSEERQVTYFQWAKAVINGLRGTNQALEKAFDAICNDFFKDKEAAAESGQAEGGR